MKGSLLKIATALALVLSFFPAAAAFASDDDEVKFSGAIESMPSSGRLGDYRIAGRTVHITSSTRIEEDDGPLAVSAIVKVEGRPRSDGSVDATEIEVKQRAPGGGQGGDDRGEGEVKFKGTVQSFLNTAGFVGDWVIGGRTVHATSRTQIKTEDGPVAVGAFAEVEGAQLADEQRIALERQQAVREGVTALSGRCERLRQLMIPSSRRSGCSSAHSGFLKRGRPACDSRGESGRRSRGFSSIASSARRLRACARPKSQAASCCIARTTTALICKSRPPKIHTRLSSVRF
jgi:Domain of unknown function (DUF5666)